MKRWTVFTLFMIASLVLSLFVSIPVTAGVGNEKVRVMVTFAHGSKAQAANALQAAGAEFHYTFNDLDTFTVSLPAAALDGIRRNPHVVLVEEDAPRFPISIQPSRAARSLAAPAGQVVPYGVDMVQARDVWDANRDGVVDAGAVTGSNMKICIIDSGFYTGHEDLQGVSVSGYNGNLPWSTDGSGHGTHVAGTIAAVNNSLGVLGVTPGTVQIYSVRVFGDDGAWAYSSTLIDAAYKCRDAGAKIISMSLGGARANNTEKNGFATLYNTNGILSIAAAGNEGTTAYSYPASYDTVVSVAAIDTSKLVADFSQKNSQVEVSAPGVGVLSTVPYLDETSLTVNGVTYPAAHIEFSARGTASGALVDGGLCDSVGAWTGKVVLCQRGTISFYDKVHNVQLGGGAAAAIYNNVSGGFSGTLGDGFSSTIIGLSLSMEDGQALLPYVNQTASVSSSFTQPASSYEYYDGTSMATPHVSAVAALVWGSKPTATNAQVRQALVSTAEDLGAAGRDTSYGYGLVRAKNAITALAGAGTQSLSVKDLDAVKTLAKSSWKVTVTITVKSATGAAVSGAVVSGAFNGAAVSCTTGAAGQCSVTATLKNTVASVTYTVAGVTASGYSYNAAGNSDPDGDSSGTSITVTK
ncbi:MAG: S8 family serine peptidase [Chloroflexota bacterium]